MVGTTADEHAIVQRKTSDWPVVEVGRELVEVEVDGLASVETPVELELKFELLFVGHGSSSSVKLLNTTGPIFDEYVLSFCIAAQNNSTTQAETVQFSGAFVSEVFELVVVFEVVILAEFGLDWRGGGEHSPVSLVSPSTVNIPPKPAASAFSVRLQQRRIVYPSSVYTAPPLLEAKLKRKVLLLVERVPEFETAPPYGALLLLKSLPLMKVVPADEIAPPEPAVECTVFPSKRLWFRVVIEY